MEEEQYTSTLDAPQGDAPQGKTSNASEVEMVVPPYVGPGNTNNNLNDANDTSNGGAAGTGAEKRYATKTGASDDTIVCFGQEVPKDTALKGGLIGGGLIILLVIIILAVSGGGDGTSSGGGGGGSGGAGAGGGTNTVPDPSMITVYAVETTVTTQFSFPSGTTASALCSEPLKTSVPLAMCNALRASDPAMSGLEGCEATMGHCSARRTGKLEEKEDSEDRELELEETDDELELELDDAELELDDDELGLENFKDDDKAGGSNSEVYAGDSDLANFVRDLESSLVDKKKRTKGKTQKSLSKRHLSARHLSSRLLATTEVKFAVKGRFPDETAANSAKTTAASGTSFVNSLETAFQSQLFVADGFSATGVTLQGVTGLTPMSVTAQEIQDPNWNAAKASAAADGFEIATLPSSDDSVEVYDIVALPSSDDSVEVYDIIIAVELGIRVEG